MSRSTAAQSEGALANLRTLLEINAQMTRENQEERLAGSPNEEVRGVLEDILDSASEQRDRLMELIREWESHARRSRTLLKPTIEARLDPRELIESWIAIKEAAAEMYKKAAADAPTARIRRELEALSREEEQLADRLRRLL